LRDRHNFEKAAHGKRMDQTTEALADPHRLFWRSVPAKLFCTRLSAEPQQKCALVDRPPSFRTQAFSHSSDTREIHMGCDISAAWIGQRIRWFAVLERLQTIAETG
jgi:hypothetical protein